MNKSRRAFALVISLIFVFSFFSVLFAFAELTSLNKELGSYIESSPYVTDVIKIGFSLKGSKSEEIYENLNKVSNLINGISGELETLTFSYEYTEGPKLTDEEAESISKVKWIKSYFLYDKGSPVFSFTIQTNAPGFKKISIFPLPADFLDALLPPLKEGRYFSKDDPENVVLISEEVGNALFSGESPLNKEVKVSTNEGKEIFKIIGVLENVTLISYGRAFGIQLDAIMPYKYIPLPVMYRDNTPVYAIPNNRMLIIPAKGKTNQVLSGIKKILGAEKYNEIVSTLKEDLEFYFGAAMRKERVLMIGIASILTILMGLFAVISFIYFDISLKHREIGIKRASGATVSAIVKEYTLSMIKLLLISFPIALVALKLSLPAFAQFNRLGYFMQFQGPTDIHPLNLNMLSIIASFLLIFALIYIVSGIFVRRALRKSPSYLMKSFEEEREKKFYFPSLVFVISICIVMLLTSISVILTQTRTINEIIVNVNPDVLRIFPEAYITTEQRDTRNRAQFANFTVEDYIAVREAFGEKAYIGYRLMWPEGSEVSDPENLPESSTFFFRMSEATEDFPELYGLKLKEGRFLNDQDKGECMVGYDIAERFNLGLGGEYLSFKVIGILDKKSPLIDGTIFVPVGEQNPYATTTPPGMFLVKPCEGNGEKIADEIVNFLQERHPGTVKGTIVNLQKVIQQIADARGGTYLVLSIFSLFALISAFLYLSSLFLIDGIKKKKEIAIRRAVGATERKILNDFVLRGLKLCSVALILGIPIGLLISFFIAKGESLNYYVPIVFLLFFIFIYLILAVLFSYIPARRASKVTPKEALREE